MPGPSVYPSALGTVNPRAALTPTPPAAPPSETMQISEAQYIEVASDHLRRLLDCIDDDDAIGEDVEAELASDILTLEFRDGSKFVINSHRAARQIWMAAGTHAWHFDYDGERWIASKSGQELWSTLSSLLSERLGRSITLRPD